MALIYGVRPDIAVVSRTSLFWARFAFPASLAACVYFVIGRCWQGSATESAHILNIGGKPWNWLGSVPPFFAGLATKIFFDIFLVARIHGFNS